MSKFKLEFTLKQHTPIIHFQSEQSRATLRATELKPKLDKFLIEYAFENNKALYEKFLIDKDKGALDYKVKIQANSTKEDEIKNKLYFGNMGKQSDDIDYRKSIFTNQNLQISFFSFSDKILSNIKEFFPSFLAKNNFGTRQNKGFGSFYIDRKDKNYIEQKKALNMIEAKYIYGPYKGENSNQVFEHIEVIYPLIKTGINFPDHPKKDHPKGFTDKNGNIKQVPDLEAGRGPKASYYKSYLFQYMLKKDNSIGNEKKFIKENFFKNTKDRYSRDDNQTKKYVRALLGVSDGIEFKDIRKGKIEYTHNQIERFKSPLTFKVIDNEVLIIAEDIHKDMFDATFTFTEKGRKEGKDISTPSKQEFDLVDFLYTFADYFKDMNVSDKNFFDKKIKKAQKAVFVRDSL